MKTKLLVSLSVLLSIYIVLSPSVSPANAQTSISITNNGSGTENSISFNQENNSEINQSNTGIISNIINIITNTGENSNNSNTSGNVNTSTGNASSTVKVENNMNYNYSKAENCCAAVPEFGMIPGALALVSSGATYFYLKKRNFSLK